MTPRPSLMHQLAEVAADLGPALAPAGVRELLTATAEAVVTAFSAAACSIVALDENAGEVVWRAAAGIGADQAVGMRLPVTQGLTGYVANSGEAIAIDDVRRDARFAAQAAQQAGYVPRSMLAVPIVSDGRVIGVLSVLDRAVEGRDSSGDLELAGRFAAVVARALPLQETLADLGASLLRAAADAVDDGDLAAALRRAASRSSGPDSDVQAMASSIAELHRMGPAERQLALEVLEPLLRYARARRRR